MKQIGNFRDGQMHGHVATYDPSDGEIIWGRYKNHSKEHCKMSVLKDDGTRKVRDYDKEKDPHRALKESCKV